MTIRFQTGETFIQIIYYCVINYITNYYTIFENKVEYCNGKAVCYFLLLHFVKIFVFSSATVQ
jgi:hypothetical protein